MLEKIITGLAAVILMSVVTAIVYNEIANEEVTVMVRLKEGEDPFRAVKAAVPSDSTLRAVEEVADDKYKLVVSTKRETRELRDWVLRNEAVEEAEIVKKKN